MKKIITSILVLFSIVAAHADGIEFNHDLKFQEALDKAKADGKLVFIDCYTSWCGPCKRLSAQVFTQPQVGAYFNEHFVNVKFDMEQGEGPDIANRYQVRAYPTLLWLDGDGNVKHKVVGGLDPDGLIENAKKPNDPMPGIVTGMKQKYTSGNREVSFLSDYLTAMQASNMKTDEVLNEYLKVLSPKDLQSETVLKTIANSAIDLKSPAVPFIQKNKTIFEEKLGKEAIAKKLNSLAEKATVDAVKTKDDALFNQAVAVVNASKTADSKQKVAKMSMDYYLKTSNAAVYDKYVSAYIKKYAATNEKLLNETAWTYYINTNETSLLAKASKWAFKAVNLKNTCANNTTYAYLQYKLENFSEAEKACDYAIIKAKEEGIAPLSANGLKDLLKKKREGK